VDLGKQTVENAGEELWADPDLLRQLLVNLMLNAADAAGPGGSVKVETDHKTIQAEGELAHSAMVRVRDNGPGPPTEIAKRLFEPFATSKPEGIGLGLAVAQQIAQAHEGRIVFHRQDGETCFEVWLPTGHPSPNLRSSVIPCPAS
jgi:signal transduction histidine kinase